MTSLSTLKQPTVTAALDRMFAQAERDDEIDTARFVAASTDKERADAAAEIYMPISPEAGRLLYSLVRAVRPKTVVEFGMSYGISTLYLAAAVRDNGVGRVVTSELSSEKIANARATFAETGLADVITILEGDAQVTLPEHLGDEAVDLLLLDGWKDLYLPVLHKLEPRLTPGTLVCADDIEMPSVWPYLSYVRDPANGYETTAFLVADGMEISCRL